MNYMSVRSVSFDKEVGMLPVNWLAERKLPQHKKHKFQIKMKKCLFQFFLLNKQMLNQFSQCRNNFCKVIQPNELFRGLQIVYTCSEHFYEKYVKC